MFVWIKNGNTKKSIFSLTLQSLNIAKTRKFALAFFKSFLGDTLGHPLRTVTHDWVLSDDPQCPRKLRRGSSLYQKTLTMLQASWNWKQRDETT